MLYLRYAWYVLRHKWWVLYYAHFTGADLSLALMHDMSKFSPAEFGPYARWFYGEHGRGDAFAEPGMCVWHVQHEQEFKRAWAHHFSNNKHHPEYWITEAIEYSDESPVGLMRRTAQAMPERYVREMIADWMGAGRAISGKQDVHNWWRQNRRRWPLGSELHPNTLHLIEQVLLVELEAEADP